MNRHPIYLDYQATTPVDPRVLDAMLPYFSSQFGNPASRSHGFGWAAEAAVDRARERIATLIGASPDAIVFTSGATESNNLAIKGVAEYYASKGRRIVTAATEHSSVLDVCIYLDRQGFEIVYLPVDSAGLVDPGMVESSLNDETILVSIMKANNEIGTIQPVREIAGLCRSRGILFHTDATQAIGGMSVADSQWGADLVSFSGHKIYGPKGIGGLYVRPGSPRVHLATQIHGGGHERNLRSGTLNVPGIVGFGAAADILMSEGDADIDRRKRLTHTLLCGLREGIPGMAVNGSESARLPGNLNLRIEGVTADALMKTLPELAFSTGSACSSGTPGPSHVLKAIGLTKAQAAESFRLSIGRNTTEEEIAYVCTAVAAAVRKLRAGRTYIR
jgi:cysteine desulfurase